MKSTAFLVSGCLLFFSLNANCDTFKYVNKGTVCYTDDLGKVPSKLRKRAVNLDGDEGENAERSPSISHGTTLAQDNNLAGLDIAELEKSARSGDLRAQNELGKRYAREIGGQGDAKARYWFTLCANKGDMACQSNLASMIMTGRGGGLPFSEGMKWLKRAADQGDAQSQYNLGREYETGGKVEVNLNEAVTFYRMAADQGFEEAQVNLGGMYMRGAGVPKNLVKARELFEKAANSGNPVAKQNLALLNGRSKLQRR